MQKINALFNKNKSDSDNQFNRLVAQADAHLNLQQFWQAIAPGAISQSSSASSLKNGLLTIYAHNSGVATKIKLTNASLLTEKKAVEIIESGLDKLFFSFDSPYREEFNKIRVKGDYDQVLNNIKNFMRIKREMKSDTPLTRVQMVTMKENEKDFDEFVKLFKPVVDTIAHIDYLDHDIQLDQDNDKTIVDLKTDQKVKFCCPQLWQRMFVHPDGVVTPCCIDSGRKMVMGNIHKSSLKDIWKNEKYQEMRKLHKEGNMNQIPTCSRCPLAKY